MLCLWSTPPETTLQGLLILEVGGLLFLLFMQTFAQILSKALKNYEFINWLRRERFLCNKNGGKKRSLIKFILEALWIPMGTVLVTLRVLFQN
jgi:hypothetical protein